MGEAALEKLGGPGAGRGRSWLRTLVRLGVVGLVLALAAGGVGYWLRYGRDEGPLRGTTQRPAPALVAADDPSRGSIAILVDGDEPLPGPEITVGVTAPDGARQMQLGFDPSFETTPWVPVDEVTTLVHHHTGHQILFARFRSGPGATPSPVSTVGVTIDPTYVAATSSVDGLHQASWIRSLGPDRLAVRVEGGRMSWGAQEPYDFDDPPAGDRVNPLWGVVRVSRDGEPYGVQVDGSESLLRRYDRLIGRPVDTGRLDDGLWLLTDSVSGARINVTSVERISRPAGTGTGHGGFFDLNGEGDPVVPLVHDLIVRLAEPLAEGRTYDVQPPGDVLEPATYTFTENETRSPAIHVNQAGYGVDDPLKVGYLSRPYLDRGSAGEPYAEGMAFTVVDEADGTVVLEGEVTARPEGDELNLGDLTGAPVFEADFSALSAEGRFRLCVATVGCSEGFSVGAEVWADLTKAVARAMYHQRSGVALGPPYTPIGRPRPYHPDDGMVIRNSDYSLLDSLDQPLGDVFDDLVAGNNGEVNPDAWGGHFDAGDWDRRIQHLFYVRSAVELVELAPERYAGLDLQIPESGDQVPDLIDEALWTLDVFYRLQRDDGAVRGGIEASQHPLPDNTSWSDDLAVFAYAPDPYSSYLYAGVAAQTAAVLAAYDGPRAADYLDSALRAMAWADEQPVDPDRADLVRGHRAVAAVALYKATGDGTWHDTFLDISDVDDGVDAYLSCNNHLACDAAWLYLSIDEALTDAAVRADMEASFVATADEVIAAAETTSYGWAVENRFAPLVWGLGPGGAPSAIGLLRAHRLTGDERYRRAALRSAAVSLGANPTNTVFVTGFGRHPVRNPVILDAQSGGLPVWAGTPIYGPHQVGRLDDESWIDEFVLGPAGVQPLAADLPYLWQWFDVSRVAMFNEFTVFQSHAEALYAYGLLADS